MDEKQVLGIIAKAKKERATVLNLSSKNLTGVPPELAQLTNLQGLSLSNNHLTAISPELAQLTNLEWLDLSHNQLTAVPPEIAQLTNLQRLYLSNNQLTAVPPEIAQLTNLQRLYLFNNQLTAVPPELAQLTNLQELSLSHNQLTAVPREIAQLTNLQVLSLSNNHLTAVPPEIAQLTNLQGLFLSNNKLMSVPPELGQLEKLEDLELSGNPLVSPPPEVVKQGTQAILAYLRGLAKAERRKWEAKLLVVGEAGVGKTELVKALQGEQFGGETATQGVQVRTLEVKHPAEADVTMRLNLWDFGGQEIQHATHQFFYSERALFMLAWNARENYEQAKLNTWLELIQARASIPADETLGREERKASVLLVATHCDLWKPDIPYEELKKQFPRIRFLAMQNVSNKTRRGIDELRAAMAEAAAELPLMGTRWPADWQKAEDELANRVQDKQSRINLGDLWTLMDTSGVGSDSHELLARALDGMGKIRVFLDDEELRNVVVLDPQWLTNRIARVLKNEDQHGRAICRHAILQRTHWAIFWPEDDEPTHRLFARMMRNFDLVYSLEDSQDAWLVVQLLPYQLAEADRLELDKLWNGFETQREMSMKWRFEQSIPPGIPMWFIAREHRFSLELHWRLGVLLADNPSDPRHLGLIQSYPERRYVQLTVRGPMPYYFFSVLRDGLEYTLARYPGLRLTKTIPCPGHQGMPCKYEFDLRRLEKAIEREEPVLEIQCQEAFENMAIPQLLFGLHWSTQDTVISEIDRLLGKRLATTESAILAALAELRALVQREFLRSFNAQQGLEESHCPNVFAVLPEGEGGWLKNLLGQKMIIRLYCQAPGEWHPTIEGGRYEIKRPAEFLESMGPYILKLAKVIKYAAPVAGAAAGAFAGPIGAAMGATYAKDLASQVKLMEELAKKLSERDYLTADLLERTGGWARAERFEGAELRALRKLLDEVDPTHHWGGLKKVLTPEGHWLWLCEEHAQEYRK